MFAQALGTVLGGVLGHFNPLLAGLLLVLGVILLRPSQNRVVRRTQPAVPARRDRRTPAALDAEEAVEPLQQRAVVGARRPSLSPPSASGARRRPPRGGGSGLFLGLVGGLVPLS